MPAIFGVIALIVLRLCCYATQCVWVSKYIITSELLFDNDEKI
jgi:hypothetical protein